MRDEIGSLTPRLRRYARALVAGGSAPSEVADALVRATLMRALGTRNLGGASDLPVRLYATLTQLHRDLEPAQRAEVVAGGSRRMAAGPANAPAAPIGKLAYALQALPLEDREALLLVALEGFDHATAARILRIAKPVLFDRLTRARTGLSRHLSAAPIPIQPQAARAAGVPYLRLVVG